MKKNKLILFDWGGIVESHKTGYTCKDAWQDLFTECGYKGDEIIFNNLSKYNLSAIPNEEEFINTYSQIKNDFSLDKSFNEFKKIYFKIFDRVDYYKDVSEYEKSLKDKCFIGILSNLNIYDKIRLDRQVNLKEYDYVFLSFEMALKKPNIKIYEEVSKHLPFSKKDILFIDDRQDNVESAKTFGWNAIELTGLELDKIRDIVNVFLEEEV